MRVLIISCILFVTSFAQTDQESKEESVSKEIDAQFLAVVAGETSVGVGNACLSKLKIRGSENWYSCNWPAWAMYTCGPGCCCHDGYEFTGTYCVWQGGKCCGSLPHGYDGPCDKCNTCTCKDGSLTRKECNVCKSAKGPREDGTLHLAWTDRECQEKCGPGSRCDRKCSVRCTNSCLCNKAAEEASVGKAMKAQLLSNDAETSLGGRRSRRDPSQNEIMDWFYAGKNPDQDQESKGPLEEQSVGKEIDAQFLADVAGETSVGGDWCPSKRQIRGSENWHSCNWPAWAMYTCGRGCCCHDGYEFTGTYCTWQGGKCCGIHPHGYHGPCEDGCNTCTCKDGDMITLTRIACNEPGFVFGEPQMCGKDIPWAYTPSPADPRDPAGTMMCCSKRAMKKCKGWKGYCLTSDGESFGNKCRNYNRNAEDSTQLELNEMAQISLTHSGFDSALKLFAVIGAGSLLLVIYCKFVRETEYKEIKASEEI